MDGIIVFSGFMSAVYRKGRFQLSITKLNQQTASKEKGKKGKVSRVGLMDSTDALSIKTTRLALKSLVPRNRVESLHTHTHTTHTPLYRQEKGQKIKKSNGH